MAGTAGPSVSVAWDTEMGSCLRTQPSQSLPLTIYSQGEMWKQELGWKGNMQTVRSAITLAFTKEQVGSYGEIALLYTRRWFSTAMKESSGGI